MPGDWSAGLATQCWWQNLASMPVARATSWQMVRQMGLAWGEVVSYRHLWMLKVANPREN